MVQSFPRLWDKNIPHTSQGFCLTFRSIHLLSCVQLFVTPWISARQASLSITNSQSLLKLMSIESVKPSNHLILCYPLLLLPSIFPSVRVFPMSQFFTRGGQSIGASTSASVQFSCSFVSNSFRPHGLQHTRPACPSPITEVYLNSCPLSR